MKSHGVLEPGSGPGGGTPRGDFCQPWRGQPAARWNRRATRPNAIRVSVVNDRVDPVSGVAMPWIHTPGLSLLLPMASDVCPPSPAPRTSLKVKIEDPPPSASTAQEMISPLALV